MSKRFLDDGNGRVAGVETVLVEWTKVLKITIIDETHLIVAGRGRSLEDGGGGWFGKDLPLPGDEPCHNTGVFFFALH